ncbi:MAG: T9SS type A sorting domain-containing protein [Brumimicrobium sp.]|nr:T9SS type A sorting domain-containing protein [Brumimicrobium sp.]
MNVKIRLFSCILLFALFARGQSSDTVAMNYYQQVADSVYGNLGTYVSSGYLLNRALMDTNALAYNTGKLSDSLVNADYIYGLMYELKLMALDSSQVPGLMTIYDDVNDFMGEIEFEEDRYVYPFGIVDLNFEWLDEEAALANGSINKVDDQYFDNGNSHLAYQTYNAKLMAPLFDLYSSDIMGVVFKPEYFYSNYRSVEDIAAIEISYNERTFALGFNEIFEFTPNSDLNQSFLVKVFYNNGDSIVNQCAIFTPELALINSLEKTGTKFPECTHEDDFSDNVNNKLQFCFINSCLNNVSSYRPKKPYILVTGFRPPIIGQSFKKTWKLYSSQHRNLLFNLRLNDYDIILVRFNIQWKPYQHGMLESADLFIKFLRDLNNKKGLGGYHENVIQGSSMGADIVRLALLKMEKLHFENNSYPHHHSRLFLAYDANFYGGNIPLAYQYQIYSGFLYPNLIGNLSLPNSFLKTFLYATMEQKTVKELLTYHAKGTGNDLFLYPQNTINWKPTHHNNRQVYYNALNQYDNQEHFFPLQSATRNIAISLGKISGTNDEEEELSFNKAGEYWRKQNLLLTQSELRIGLFSTNFERLFKRRRINMLPFPFIAVNHEINVREMQEIDNAPGSYLKGAGNIIAVTDWAHFTLQNLVNGKNFFSHKSTFTALGINPNLWPSDGSHTLNMQGLNLMFNDVDPNTGVLIESNYFGYPNLGRPNDHFDVTPFEAIYVGENIHPHIVLEESDDADVDAINGFILNEVEPWYLGLQNENLGAQARSNYTYKAHRRAKYRITTGHLVTPKTDPGDYNVEPNADLKLEAGESIHLKPGTYIKAGAKAHLFINYAACSGGKSMLSSGNEEDNSNSSSNDRGVQEQMNTTAEMKININLYPNPSANSFTVASMEDIPIDNLYIFNLSGKLVHSEDKIDAARYDCAHNLEGGTYLMVITCVDGSIHRKKIVVL